MSDLLFVTMDAGGNVPPMLDIARAAVASGHRVHILGHERIRPRTAERGLDLIAFRNTRPWDAAREQSVLHWAAMLNDRRIGDEVRRVCGELQPDVAVVDCMLPPAQAAVDDLGIPRVVLTHTVKAFFDGPYRFTSALASRLAGYDIVGLWNRAQANLVTTVPSLDPAASRPHPANVHWVGVVGPDTTPAHPAEGAPLVLVSLSTNGFPGQRRTLRRVIAALGALPVRAVVTTGDVFDPETFEAPPNVTVVGYADHLEILPECSLVIGHGGHSTTVRALAHDVPLIVIPSNPMTDQPLLGRTVAEAGLGLVLRRSASSRAIREAVESVLGDPRFRLAAATIGREIRAQDGAANAVDRITGAAVR